MHNRSNTFLCGVVEGFYGRPWTSDQRKELFQRMKSMQMNTYVYAPKDDCKHRRFWRELYSVEEIENLQSLVQAAQAAGVTFIYAISPGLDMVFSKEVHLLKRKLVQVSELGCKSFALLFDDIDIELCHVDKEVFQSPAHAQVSVTNEVFQHLGAGVQQFLFCPTEYCASRAQPDVRSSAYLNIIGSRLLPGIHVMWTGPKVVSKEISVASVKELAEVLRRRPLIWDNIHANDYDPKRVFLGPFEGRSPELIPHLAGVLTNPNCEFEVNFVALSSLADWARSSPERVQLDALISSSPVKSDIQLESEGAVAAYSPEGALRRALAQWLPMFYRRKRPPPAPAMQPAEPSAAAAAAAVGVVGAVGTGAVSATAAPAEFALPEPLPQPVNSLVEPMEVEPNDDWSPACSPEEQLTMDELLLVCHLFYEPFQHGPSALVLLEDFQWLKCNAHLMSNSGSVESDCTASRPEWLDRAARFRREVARLRAVQRKLEAIPNRAIAFELLPYVADMSAILGILDAYLNWLRCTPGYAQVYSSGEHEPWMFRGGIAAEFQRMLPLEAGQDLLVGKAAELPPSPHPPPQPSARVYSVRPYSAADRSSVYAICALTAPMRIAGASTSAAAGSNGVVVDDAAAAASVAVSIAGPGPGVGIMSAADAELYGDRYAGLLLELSCDYCFVLESDTGVCGFVCAALDVAKLRDQAGEFFGLMRRRHPMLRRRGAGGAVSSAGTGAGGGHEAAVHPAA
uniref:protein O-GlcNAcase n=1 Tax=Macrostomum lignano TaxID=282301 RepID=A0A1I8HQU2_9PLAT